MMKWRFLKPFSLSLFLLLYAAAFPLIGNEGEASPTDFIQLNGSENFSPVKEETNEPHLFPEPLKGQASESIAVPKREERDRLLEKMFEDLSYSSITDKTIGVQVRKEYRMWEDSIDSGSYDIQAEGLLTLQKLLERAYEKNPEIKILQAQLNQSKLDVLSAKSNYFPKIQFEGSISLTSKPLLGAIDIHQGQFGSYPLASLDPNKSNSLSDGSPAPENPKGGMPPGSDKNLSFPNQNYRIFDGVPRVFYRFAFTLEQPLFSWGKIPMAVEAYKTAVAAAELQIAKKKKEVRSEISIYYQSLYYLDKIRTKLVQATAVMEKLLKMTNESYKTGFILYTDYLDVQVKAQQLIANEYKIHGEYEQILIKLASKVGLNRISTDMIDFTPIDENWIFQPLDKERYYQLALTNNLDLQLLELLKEANELQAKIEKSRSYLKPDFGLQLSLGTMGPDFPFLQRGWYGHNNQNLIASIGFKSTLLDGGEILATAMKKNEEINKTLYQIQLGKAEVHSFVASQLLQLELNLKNLNYYQLKTDSDAQVVKIRKIRFQAGGSEIDYLRSQIEFLTNSIQIDSERIGMIKNYYTLIFVAGLI